MASSQWCVGFGRRVITPASPVWLAGYGVRTRPSEGVTHDLYAKAVAIEDKSGSPSVILSADILGLTSDLSAHIETEVQRRFGLDPERLVLYATHNHSSPVNTGVIPLIYNLSEADLASVENYTQWMIGLMVEAIGDALHNREPARLSFGQGFAGFGVNRRRARPGCRHLPGPVDQDVPVLKVCGMDGVLRGCVFGYACHTTALSGYDINGDFAGYAQLALEAAHPGATALFIPGCAGDINPLPRGSHTRAELHGNLLAEAVCDVLSEESVGLSGPLRTAQTQIPLAYASCPSVTELRLELDRITPDKWFLHQTTIVPPALRLPEKEARRVAEVLASNERKILAHHLRHASSPDGLASGCNLPAAVWNFGEGLRWLHFGGEPVVDYALNLKARYGWEDTWVSGYYRDLTCYIPSLRVLQEGDYEGTEGMREYGHPSVFAPSVESDIIAAFDDLINATLP